MSGHLSAPRVPHASAQGTALARDRGLQPLAKGMVCTRAEIVQPRRLNWARYSSVVRDHHNKIMVTGALVSSATLLILSWRVAGGEVVSPGRWLLGAGAGWFVIGMLRLALFVALSGPRCVRFSHGRLFLSGLGELHPQQILGWSLCPVRKRRRQKPSIQVELRCRWHGWARRWVMRLEDDWQTAELHHLLRAACPHAEEHVPPAPEPPVAVALPTAVAAALLRGAHA